MNIQKFKKYFITNKKTILCCLFTVFVVGMIAHGYAFSNTFLSHDYLNEVFSNNDHKIELGRVLYPVYKLIFRGNVSAPWLVGFFGLLWLSATLYLITISFNKNDNYLFIIFTGIFLTTNVTVTSTIATYLHDFDANMFSVFMATLAFVFWKKDNLKSYLLSVLCMMISIGIYQSQIQVTITLIIINSIINLLNNDKFINVFSHGLKAIVCILIAIGFYAILVAITLKITGVALQDGGYNSVLAFTTISLSSVANLIYECYYYYIYYALYIPWVDSTSLSLVINGLLMLACVILLIINAINNKVGIKEKILLIILLCILPIGSNGIYIVSNGAKHHVMEYAVYLDYLLLILLLQKSYIIKGIKYCLILLMVVAASENIRTSNDVYLKKDLEYDATKLYMNNVVYDMNSVEGYIPGETKVMFIGYPDFSYRIDNMEYTYRIGGCYYSFAIQKYKNYDAFFKYVLQQPINLVIEDKEYRLQIENKQEVKEMGYYPSEDSIKMVDDILIVKFADSGY